MTHSGGLFSIWDPSKFKVSHKQVGDHWIVLEGCIISVCFDVCVGFIYSPNDRVNRIQMYDTLRSLFRNVKKPLLLLGDFNEILHPNERIGQFKYDVSMKEFANWINELYLIYIPLHGIKLT